MKSAGIAALLLLLVMNIWAETPETTQQWTPGWNNLNQQLNYDRSNVVWSVTAENNLKVTYNLFGAVPNKVYQVGVHIFCTTFPTNFGQFPTYTSAGGTTCEYDSAQGVTVTLVAVELGEVLTDLNGDGSTTVVVHPVPAGTYNLEFDVRNGAGCDLVNRGPCNVNFQSPGPIFGMGTTVTVP